MSKRCSANQVAEVICILSITMIPIEVIEFEDIEDFTCVDIILSTIIVFVGALRKEMEESYKEFMEQTSISKKSFIDFLKPRALLLTEKNEHFDFVLVCTYFYQILIHRSSSHDCFHLARAACKLLSKILEDRFGVVFKTEADWENLILYCRNIHAAVYPSEKNRPPGYVPYLKRFEGDDYFSSFEDIEDNKVEKSTAEIENSNIAETTKDIGDDKMAESEKETDNYKIEDSKKAKEEVESFKKIDGKKEVIKENEEKENLEKKRLENNTESDEMFLAELLGLTERDSSSTDDDSTDDDTDSIINDANYWKYFSLDHVIKCERVTHNEEHLKNVYNLLEELKKDMHANCIPSDVLNISFSDDEYIELLDNEDKKSKPLFSNSMRQMCAKKICKEQNKKTGATSGQDKVNPEDITEDQINDFILKEYYDDPKCEVCEDKIRAFTKQWEKNFREKYTNWSMITDCI